MELINSFPDFDGAFGDRRIDKKAASALQKLMIGRNSSIRQITQTEAEQRSIYRLLDNEAFSEKAIASKIMERCGSLCAGRHVLCIQDTSEFNLSGSKRLKPDTGLGDISKTGVRGFLLHSSLVVDAQKGSALGFSYIKTWHRDEERQHKQERQYHLQPTEQKESYKWIEATTQSKELLKDAAAITIVADRESDIYELYALAREHGMHVVLRSRFNRPLASSDKMLDYLQSLDVMHRYSLPVLGDIRKGIEKRVALMDLKWSAVSIKRPGNSKDKSLPIKLDLYVVEAKEQNNPKGICWRILTTHPVNNAQDALQVIDWYKQRWHIEQVHRLLKKEGFRIEQSQLESGYAIRKLTMLATMAVLRIIQMMLAYEDDSEQEASALFDQDEQKCLTEVNLTLQGGTIKQQNTHKQGTIKWATWIIARLGGWKGYRSQRKPGPIVLQKGFIKFYNLYEGWNLYQKHLKDVYTQ